MRYLFRGTPITELDDDRLRTALEKHLQKEPTCRADVLVYQALTAEWNKRYDERERIYQQGEQG